MPKLFFNNSFKGFFLAVGRILIYPLDGEKVRWQGRQRMASSCRKTEETDAIHCQ
jgi:hypothetical protein